MPSTRNKVPMPAMSAAVDGKKSAVAPSGNDANSGLAGKPFRTIQKAADVMTAGDVCRIAGGTYRETVTVKASGAAGAPLRFVGAPGQVVTISGAELVKAKFSTLLRKQLKHRGI